jgi:serine protease Do
MLPRVNWRMECGYAVVALVLLGAAPLPAQQASPAASPLDVEFEDLEVPEVFAKTAPAGVDDLRRMEQHVQRLSERAIDCTVSVHVGGAQGSGVIVTPDGYVLTCAHVIGRPGRRCSIIFPDGTRRGGETLGLNTMLDAGLVKITDTREGGWPYAAMATRESIKVGDWCVATGHPGGFLEDRRPVLRLGRVIFSGKRILQSDCELVGGDSGGPLFDMRGRVIAVNSRIQDSTSANYHVPISAYSDDWERLIGGEEFQTHSGAFLGMGGEPVDEGLKVTKVYEGEAADFAGLKVGDIITTFESRRVRELAALTELVGRENPGAVVRLEILREGEPMTLRVRLGMRWD